MSEPDSKKESHEFRRRGKGPKYDKRDINIGVQNKVYGDNSIRTSKYLLWNFFILNLFEQFKKPANIYFLVR